MGQPKQEGGMSEHGAQRWGRGLDADAARQYCGCDVERTPGAPPPVKVSPRRKIWLREELDAWLDRMAGKDPASQGSIWDE